VMTFNACVKYSSTAKIKMKTMNKKRKEGFIVNYNMQIY